MKKIPTCTGNHFRTLIPLRNKQSFVSHFQILLWNRKANKQNCFKNICCEETLQIKLIGEHFLTALSYRLLYIKKAAVIWCEHFTGVSQTYQNFGETLEKQGSWHCLTAVQTIKNSFQRQTRSQLTWPLVLLPSLSAVLRVPRAGFWQQWLWAASDVWSWAEPKVLSLLPAIFPLYFMKCFLECSLEHTTFSPHLELHRYFAGRSQPNDFKNLVVPWAFISYIHLCLLKKGIKKTK